MHERPPTAARRRPLHAMPGGMLRAMRHAVRRVAGLAVGLVAGLVPGLLPGLAAGLFVGLPAPAAAHELPADVRVIAYVRPEATTLRLLMRVPLAAFSEADLPLRGPGYLDLARADAALRTAVALALVDNLTLVEAGRPLGRPTIAALRVSLASDRAFGDYAGALAHVRSPSLPADAELYWKHQLLDVLLEYPIESPDSRFAIDARLARLGLRVAIGLHFLPQPGTERAFQLHGDEGPVALDPSWTQAAARFVVEGLRHILGGADHLLFVAALVIPLRRVAPLLAIVTAFTVAHSLTLGASVLGVAPDAVWFGPLVETLIAVSVLLMALGNLLGTASSGRWLVAFAFGLVHGFGFAFGLRESLQFAGGHLAIALMAFNLGVEIGQVAVLLVLVPVLRGLQRHLPARPLALVLSAAVAHTAWHWVEERWASLAKVPLPTPDSADWPALLRWLAATLAVGLALWVVHTRSARVQPRSRGCARKKRSISRDASGPRGSV